MRVTHKTIVLSDKVSSTLNQDVYKRQAARRIARVVEAGLTPIYCVGETLEEHTTGPVSYTHLDVYKRQGCYGSYV